jgi:hypothetical protein
MLAFLAKRRNIGGAPAWFGMRSPNNGNGVSKMNGSLVEANAVRHVRHLTLAAALMAGLVALTELRLHSLDGLPVMLFLAGAASISALTST